MSRPPLTAERVRELFSYNPDTGDLVWRVCRGQAEIGAVAGYPHTATGCRFVGVDGRMYKAHRLIWLLVYGDWPYPGVDHINRDRMDNRLTNLREANQSQNGANRGHGSSKTGVKGVFPMSNGRFKVAVRVMGRQIHVGCFGNTEDASLAYIAEAKKHFGEFARVG